MNRGLSWVFFMVLETFFVVIIIALTIRGYGNTLGFINLWLIVIYLTMRRKEAKDE